MESKETVSAGVFVVSTDETFLENPERVMVRESPGLSARPPKVRLK
jgi:hypothetical protein